MKELEAVYTTSRHLAPCLFAIWMLLCISTSYCFITQSRLNSLWPYGLKPARFLCPWDFPGKNIGVGCHFLHQRIFSTQGLNPCLLHWQTVSLLLSHQGNPHLVILFYQVGCWRQVLGPGALGKPRGNGWRGRWEGGLGWGTHVNPWLFHFNVWQNPPQIKKKKNNIVVKGRKCFPEFFKSF